MKIYIHIIFICLLISSVSFVEGKDTEVKKIHFIGNSTFEPDELRELLHSEEGEDFEARLVKIDKILITNFYLHNGFLTVSVFDSLIIDRDRKEVFIYYKIIEGRRYYFGKVQYNGNKEISTSTLNNVFGKTLLQSPFNEETINLGKQKVENVYYNNGKPFVEVKVDYEFEQDSLVITKFDIIENQTVYIKEIKYTGLRRVKTFLIRRELELKKGDLYNREKLDISQKNIYGTGLFDYVRFEIKPIEGNDNNVILLIFVQERNQIWVGLRAGYAYQQEISYGNTFDFTAEGGHRNLFGTARSIRLEIEPSYSLDADERKITNTQKKYSFVFVEPWIGYTRTPGIFNVSYLELRISQRDSLDVVNLGFNVRHEFKNYIEISGGIEADFVNKLSATSTNPLYEDFLDKNQIYSINFFGIRDKRDNIFNPMDGSYTSLSLRFAYSIGYTNIKEEQINRYFKITSSWKRYQPVKFKLFKKRRKITFATRFKGGVILELGGNKEISDTDKFFAGGASSVRGYREQLLGPISAEGNADGGKMLFLTNAELRIPLIWSFIGEVFIDGGNVTREIIRSKPLDVRFSTGLGLALLTPIGPVRFDYGYKLNRDKNDDDPDSFHIGVYFAF